MDMKILLVVLLAGMAAAAPSLSVLFPPEGSMVYVNETAHIFVLSNESLPAVTIKMIKPVQFEEQMAFDGTYWRYSFVPAEKGAYYFSLNSSNENGTAEIVSFFFAIRRNETVINVEVLPSCIVGISDVSIPKSAKMNKDYVVSVYISNLGNIHLYEEPLSYVLDKYNNKVGVFLVNQTYSLNCPGNLTRLEMFDTYKNGTPLYMDEQQCLWKSIVNEYGIYRYVTEVNYSSVNETYSEIPLPILREGRNCTEDTYSINCTKTVEKCRYDTVGLANLINLTTRSNLTVPDMDPNYTAYEGFFEGKKAVSFRLKSCDSYCYLCLTEDENLTEGECAYEGGIIYAYLYQVYSIGFDGKTADLRRVEKRCSVTDLVYNCTKDAGYGLCNITASCTGLARKETQFKIPEPAKIVIIREKPEHVYQEGGLKTLVRTILFNRGDTTALNVSFKDNITGVCSYPCPILSFSCSSEYNVTCSFTLNGSVAVNLSQIPVMEPKQYVIIEYLLEQANDSRLYLSPTNHYFLNGTVSYYVPVEDRNITSYEDDPDINTEESRRIYFVNDSYFEYNLDIDLGNNITDRHFPVNTNLTIRVFATFHGRQKPSYSITLSAPDSWVLYNCSSPFCSCSVNDSAKAVACSSNSSISDGQEIYFDVAIKSLSETYFLTPIQENIGNTYYFRPGLFSLSRPITEKEKNATQGEEEQENATQQPQPQPQPEPEPQPTPGNQPETGEAGEVRIVITPAKPEWEGYQEEWIPVVINISNVGDVPVYNITIFSEEPVFKDLWEYFNATVQSIDPNETLNRTILLKPSFRVPPGTYTIIVKAEANNTILDINYFTLRIKEGRNLTGLEIIEYPLLFGMRPNSNATIPILIKNTGKIPLTEVTARLENIEDCLASFSSSVLNLSVNETATLKINVSSLAGPETCNATVIISTAERHYEAIPIIIKISPPPAFFPAGMPIYPAILAAYNLLLFFMIRREKRMKKVPKNYDNMIKAMLIIDFLLVAYAVLSSLGYAPIL